MENSLYLIKRSNIMIRNIGGIFLTILLVAVVYFLNRPMADKPALGKFFSPTHGFWKSTVNKENKNTSFTLKCLKGNATIVYDEMCVPHIFADNEQDLLYAQGYAEAKDRLWQMEFQIYAASGRLCELVGDKALELDRFHRRIGIVRAAEKAAKEIASNPVSKMVSESFTAGVNAYIKQLKKADLPIEYKLMGYEPEPWTTLKSAILVKFMAKDLTYYDIDVENTNALRVLGSDLYKKLYPDFPEHLDPIIPIGTKWNFKSVDSFDHVKPNKGQLSDVLYNNPYKQFYANPNYGSNNWCVNGSKTASGKPILCGDPHLQLNLPSIWYEVQLSCPGLNVYGVTLPGAPGVIIGHNENIAWSVTNSERDVINNFSVEYQDKTRKAYKLGDTFVPFEYDVETIKIRGKKAFTDSIKMTKAGAIVYDENFGEVNDKKHLATYWRAEEPSNDLLAFYYLNHAKNQQDYLNALNYYSCPGQNFIYADKDNNIAIRQQGNFMLRVNSGDGSFVTPLADVNLAKLKARIPNEQNPYILNPERGFCSSANQNPVDENYPYLTNGQYENYRNRVINSTLSESQKITWQDMGKLQNNNLSLLAKETLPVILLDLDSIPQDAVSKEIFNQLKNWDYYTAPDKRAPVYFYHLADKIQTLTYDELDKKGVSFIYPQTYNTAYWLVYKPDLSIFDILNTPKVETAKDIVRLAFKQTVDDFSKEFKKGAKREDWADFKNTTILHLAQLNAFSYAHLNIGGYHNIVNAAADRWGPSWRMIVDFANGKPQCYAVYPGGQSGNPGTKSYNQFIEKWVKGEYFTKHFFASKNDALEFIASNDKK